jgi:hypothetical protein
MNKMKILEKIVNAGKYIAGTASLLAMASGCATTTTYDVNQFCGKMPFQDGTVKEAVKRVDDRGIEISYLRVENDSEIFEKMDYDGDGFSETQVYRKTHSDGSKTFVRCANDEGVLNGQVTKKGAWTLSQTEKNAAGEIVKEDYQIAR